MLNICQKGYSNCDFLVGPAIVPPARSFSAALGPFLLVTLAGVDNTMRIPNSRKGLEELPILQLNPWSAFLVLMSLQSAIFQFSQESMIMRTFTDDEETDVNISNEEEDTSVRYLATMLHNSHSIRRGQLSGRHISIFKYSTPSHAP